jgi:sepiapterin reductase
MSSSTFLMVSGASRGLGQAMAVAFAAQLSASSPSSSLQAVLLARSSTEETVQAMQRAASDAASSNNSTLKIDSYTVDFGNLDTLEAAMEPVWKRHPPNVSVVTTAASNGEVPSSSVKYHHHAILVNCAGTTGTIGKLPTNLQEIRQATDLNFTSKAWLTTQFIQRYAAQAGQQSNAAEEEETRVSSSTSTQNITSRATIINVSSMCAVKPTPTMALYCGTSAGREMFHRVLAADHAPNNVRVLNYAPGSCNTNMQAQLRSETNLDPAVQAYCHSLVNNANLVDCADTADYLVQRVLHPNGFDTGERIEFVDASTYKY